MPALPIRPKYRLVLSLTYGFLAFASYVLACATLIVLPSTPWICIFCIILALICCYRSGLEHGRYHREQRRS
ncbi:MAG: hypothetical protein M3N59_01935 [bacterium]|nr:hypothetical protein [bacterium]